MSTDKTLADVKPGGMVRLGDVLPPLPKMQRFTNLYGETYAYSAEQMLDYARAALSAQPSPATCKEGLQVQLSPAGQGDALAMVRSNLRSIADLASKAGRDPVAIANINCEVTHALQLLDLAARQPVGVGDAIDQALSEVIDQRDRCEEVADKLADHIALITGVDIGEHSSANCPWQNAIEAAEEYKPAQAVDLGPTFQNGVADLMGQCFLPSLYSNMTERGDRLLEEVLELLQAHGYDKARVPTLVDYVFGRPVGEPAQEVGGVMVTLAGYCWVAGLDMHAAGDAELARINQPDVMAKIRAKQEAKNALHFDTPLPGDPTATDAWPREGDLVRYGDGASELAIRLQPHAGGWHGYQCCGGYTFFTKAYRPSRADMDTWLDCAKYRDGRTKVADNRVAHEMYLLDSQAVGK